MGDSGTCDSFPEFNRKKVSPRKQSSCLGCKVLLAKGLGWQHHSSTKAFQFSLGRGRTLRNFLRGKKKKHISIYYILFQDTRRGLRLLTKRGRNMAFSQKEVLNSAFSQRHFLWMNSEKAMAECFLPSLWRSTSQGWISNDYKAELGIILSWNESHGKNKTVLSSHEKYNNGHFAIIFIITSCKVPLHQMLI